MSNDAFIRDIRRVEVGTRDGYVQRWVDASADPPILLNLTEKTLKSMSVDDMDLVLAMYYQDHQDRQAVVRDVMREVCPGHPFTELGKCRSNPDGVGC